MSTIVPTNHPVSEQRLSGKRVLVTGAGSGIGRSVAIRLGREGAMVGLAGRRKRMLEKTSEELHRFHASFLVLPTDISRENEVRNAVRAIIDTWEGLDVCIAIAGIETYRSGDERVDRLTLQNWQRMININLTGTFLTCKYAVRAMIETSRGGSIVITGSPTGIYGMALGQHAYSASKAGCHGLVRVMAAEYASENIRVNCVIPGFIDTPINKQLLDDTQRLNRLVEKIPLRRAGSSDEMAGIYAWLASGDSSYVTGAFFFVDGGLTATL